jgi:tripartite-type tricarboxylate transporter receptor subunit TctC
VRWIVPFPPGSAVDVVARLIAPGLSERLKQPVIIDNRPGGFGIIGMEAAVSAAPDGYTIFFATSNEAINPVVRKAKSDPETDLTPVSQLARVSFVLLANPDFPARTVPALLERARSTPGAVTCAFSAPVFQIACELLKTRGHVDLTSVYYKGGGGALNDLVGKQVDLMFMSTGVAHPLVKAGRIAAIATANAHRGLGPFGELPTIGETLPGFELESWFGVLAPKATSREVVLRLNRELGAVLDAPSVHNRLTEDGIEIRHASPEAFADLMHRDRAKFAEIVRAAGLNLQ